MIKNIEEIEHKEEIEEIKYIEKIKFNAYSHYLKYKERYIFFFILFVGIFVRVWDFGKIPAGFNQDEAFAAYESYSMANYGMDSAGKVNPCYFISWGSGMNVLESYLAIPFIKIFGLSVVSFRLPQLIMACVSLPAFFFLLKEIFTKKVAFIGFALLSIMPWHIMLSRWGLESNLAPAFLLLGLLFFIKGVKNNKYFLLSALFYGLSLYAYATVWIVVPMMVASFIIYMVVTKKKVKTIYASLSIAILFLLALPLVLFLLVNKDIIPEIRTAFFTVPKLAVMRDGEVSIKNLFQPKSYFDLINLIFTQNDHAIWNTTETFGLFYKISTPFYILGLVTLVRDVFFRRKNHENRNKVFILIGLICSFVSALMISNTGVNRVNFLHMFIVVLIAIGIKELYVILKCNKIVITTILSAFTICFIWFSSYYFSSYNDNSSYAFRPQLGDAIKYSESISNNGIVNVDNSIHYPYILFYNKVPTNDFVNTVRYTNYPAAFLNVDSFLNYKCGIDYENLNTSQIYIFPTDNYEKFSSENFTINTFGNFCVAEPKY